VTAGGCVGAGVPDAHEGNNTIKLRQAMCFMGGARRVSPNLPFLLT
jgi:hypothetical protein